MHNALFANKWKTYLGVQSRHKVRPITFYFRLNLWCRNVRLNSEFLLDIISSWLIYLLRYDANPFRNGIFSRTLNKLTYKKGRTWLYCAPKCKIGQTIPIPSAVTAWINSSAKWKQLHQHKNGDQLFSRLYVTWSTSWNHTPTHFNTPKLSAEKISIR